MASREIVYKDSVYSLSYEILNPKNEKIILFLHGWGSNKEIMKQAFSDKLQNFKQIYLDLPGFGNSSINEPIDTYEYALIVDLFINSLHVKVDTILGHSFGGKVATLLNSKNLILLSSAGIVVEKSFKVKSKIKFFKLFKNLFPKNMYKYFASDDVKNMNQTMYEILKKVVNEDFSNNFKKTTSNTLIFWGKDDQATPLASGKYIANLINDSKFFPYDGDHFFFINKSNQIVKRINEYI